MNQQEKQIQQTIEVMQGMCRALVALSSEVLPVNRQKFALLAEGPLEDLRRLQEEVDLYVAEALRDYQERETVDKRGRYTQPESDPNTNIGAPRCGKVNSRSVTNTLDWQQQACYNEASLTQHFARSVLCV